MSLDRVAFPNIGFAWAFALLLLSLLIPASYIDAKRLVIPKWVSLPTLALGLVMSLARGAALGSAWGGLKFGLSGASVGFGLFFILWCFRTCGGGDVKLFAATGAWVGPYLIGWVLAGTVALVAVMILARFGWTVVSPSGRAETPETAERGRLVSFSLPLTIVTAVVLFASSRPVSPFGTVGHVNIPPVTTSGH